MATAGHVLTATDAAMQAFFRDADITDLADASIVRGKECISKDLPLLICACDRAERKRAKNWEVHGSLKLITDPANDDGQLTDAELDATTTMEAAVLNTIEDLVPADDRPHAVAAAITADMIAAGLATADTFLMTAFQIERVTAGFDEDLVWVFQVDFVATVIA